jgi:hypothetical protein
VLALICGLAVPAAAIAQDEHPPTRTFEVTLIRATEGAQAMPPLQDPDAIDALTDLMDVLPYSAFEVIDSGRIMTGSAARVRLGEAGAFQVYLQIDSRGPAGLIFVDHFELDQRAFEHDGEWIYNDPEGLLATSFGIRPGETIVVGTSRVMYEDEAIIVLVKALD